MPTKSFEITLARRVGQKTSAEIIRKQVLEIIRRGLSGGRNRGWSYSIARPGPPSKTKEGLWAFTRKVTFKKKSQLDKVEDQFKEICRHMIKRAQGSGFKQYPWLLKGSGVWGLEELYNELADEGKVAPMANTVVAPKSVVVKSYGGISTKLENHFDHIYGRENQVRIIHSALVAATESNLTNRYHCVLEGPPGGGKSEILTAVGRILGKENVDYLKWDATSTTKAGAERILLESAFIPPVLMMEEIEKTDDNSVRWLLGILDHRAEIKKVNFNIGQRARNVKLLCLATVNDIELFKKVMSGALHSRFAHEIHCPRPDRLTMQKILEREVAKVSGKKAWIEHTLKFCMDEHHVDDPRKVIPICLCGRDDLLNGSYQQAILKTRKPKQESEKADW